MQILPNSFFIIIGTSILTTFFSYWVFTNKRFWELKVKTYINIMESLHYVKKYNDLCYSELEDSMRCNFTDEEDYRVWEERQQKRKESQAGHGKEYLLKKMCDLSLAKIEKTIDVSSFIIKQEALDELAKLKNEYVRGIGIHEEIEVYAEDITRTIDACVDKMRVIAKRDTVSLPNMVLDMLKTCWQKLFRG